MVMNPDTASLTEAIVAADAVRQRLPKRQHLPNPQLVTLTEAIRSAVKNMGARGWPSKRGTSVAWTVWLAVRAPTRG